MALSGTFTFTLNRQELIKKVLLMLGVISPSQTPTSDETTSASNSLNLMLKAWQADGLQLWQTDTVSVTPTANADYLFGDGTYTSYQPIDILEVYRKTTASNIWVELIRLSRNDFNTLSDHDSTGTPVNFYYNNGETTGTSLGTLSIWQIADSNFIANNTLEVLLTKPFDDMSSDTDNLAFPQAWELAVVYGLCVILAREYGLPLSDQQLLMQQAEMEKDRVMNWDMEHTSVFFTPSNRTK